MAALLIIMIVMHMHNGMLCCTSITLPHMNLQENLSWETAVIRDHLSWKTAVFWYKQDKEPYTIEPIPCLERKSTFHVW